MSDVFYVRTAWVATSDEVPAAQSALHDAIVLELGDETGEIRWRFFGPSRALVVLDLFDEQGIDKFDGAIPPLDVRHKVVRTEQIRERIASAGGVLIVGLAERKAA